jgi:ribosomal protein S12 methylthiotransferase accessory factor
MDTPEIVVTMAGGRRIDARIGRHVVHTDQPVDSDGEDAAPSPFQLFLASIGTCAGIFVEGFCRKRAIPTEGVRVIERPRIDPETGTLAAVEIDIEVPPSFPEKYRDALVRVADGCSVKRAILAQPRFEVRTVVAGERG